MTFYILSLWTVLAVGKPNNIADRFSEIVRKDSVSAAYCPDVKEGEVCTMTWKEAVAYCKTRSSHLPSAREYAELIKPRGTKLLEVDEVDAAAIPKDYYLVACKNPDGSEDGFYLNHSAYKRPKDEVGNHLLWTASIPPKQPQYAHVYYDEWGGGGGKPEEHLLTVRNAVQCVRN